VIATIRRSALILRVSTFDTPAHTFENGNDLRNAQLEILKIDVTDGDWRIIGKIYTLETLAA
jgi:hypothetical protein